MNGKGMSMENVHVNLTSFTSVPATSKIDLTNEKREGYVTFNGFGASNMTLRKQEKLRSSLTRQLQYPSLNLVPL